MLKRDLEYQNWCQTKLRKRIFTCLLGFVTESAGEKSSVDSWRASRVEEQENECQDSKE